MIDLYITPIYVGDYIELYEERVFFIRNLQERIIYPSGTKARIINISGLGSMTRIDIQFEDGNVAYTCDTHKMDLAPKYNPGEEPQDTKIWAEVRRKVTT